MLTFKHQTWLKCQTSLQGLNNSKCTVSWVPTDFNQAAASTREMKLSLQLCLPMKGQVGLQVLTMARLQSPPEAKGKPLTDFNSIWTKPQAFVPYWNPLWNSTPLWFAAGSVRWHFVYIFMCGERRVPYSSHWLFSRTCFHSLLLLTLCNTLGWNFPLQMFALGGIILGKDQLEQYSSFSKASNTDRRALLSVSRNLPTSSLRSSIASHQRPKTCEMTIISRPCARSPPEKPPVVR